MIQNNDDPKARAIIDESIKGARLQLRIVNQLFDFKDYYGSPV